MYDFSVPHPPEIKVLARENVRQSYLPGSGETENIMAWPQSETANAGNHRQINPQCQMLGFCKKLRMIDLPQFKRT